jgi:predicted adenylyl cyclase CyaB
MRNWERQDFEGGGGRRAETEAAMGQIGEGKDTMSQDESDRESGRPGEVSRQFAGAPGQLRRNLELKARHRSRAGAIRACESLGAEDHGVLEQRDTYFATSHGRLKLREEGDRAELIAYRRPDSAGERESRFRLIPVDDPTALQAALEDVLGVVAVVDKSRRLFLWHGVRIHLDQVKDLGDFIEFEAPVHEGQSVEDAADLLSVLVDRLGVEEAMRIATSYCDLIVERGDIADAYEPSGF